MLDKIASLIVSKAKDGDQQSKRSKTLNEVRPEFSKVKSCGKGSSFTARQCI